MTNTPIAAKLAEACRPFAAIKADDNDDFSRYDNDVVLRVEIMAGEIKALREALAEYDTAKWAEPPSPAMEQCPLVASGRFKECPMLCVHGYEDCK